MGILLIISAGTLFSGEMQKVYSGNVQRAGEGHTVVIDAGHGGIDPGKIGVDGTLEKDLNLVIALRVKKLLEQQDVEVIMTRETDTGLYDETSGNKK